jgi:hypothetical protein
MTQHGQVHAEYLLERRTASGRFDLILLTRGNLLSAECLRVIGKHGHLHFRHIDACTASVRKTAELCASVSAASPDAARKLGGVFVQEGFDPEVHFPVKPDPEQACDAAVIGQPYGSRFRIVTALRRRGYSVRTAGSSRWPGADGTVMLTDGAFRTAVASAAVNLSINLCDDLEGYTSNRVFLLAACGGFVLANHFPGIEAMFDRNRHLAWYEDEEEVPDHVQYYLDHPDERARIAKAGRQRVLERWSLDHTVRGILQTAGLR